MDAKHGQQHVMLQISKKFGRYNETRNHQTLNRWSVCATGSGNASSGKPRNVYEDAARTPSIFHVCCTALPCGTSRGHEWHSMTCAMVYTHSVDNLSKLRYVTRNTTVARLEYCTCHERKTVNIRTRPQRGRSTHSITVMQLLQ